jgi:hypothetical protein
MVSLKVNIQQKFGMNLSIFQGSDRNLFGQPKPQFPFKIDLPINQTT